MSSLSGRDLSVIIKAYDIRGTYPDQLDEDLAQAVGTAFVEVLGVRASDGGAGAVVVGHDMRPSGPSLVSSFAQGFEKLAAMSLKLDWPAQTVCILHRGV